MTRDNGGILGSVNIPTGSAAKGVWRMDEVYQARVSGAWPGQLPVATGGTETTVGGYRYHQFTSSGTFTVNSGVTAVDYIVVGGGGSGGNISLGNFGAGGGGGGGFRTSTGLPITPGSYPVTVGAGGSVPAPGSPSTWNSIVSAGGGRGGNPYASTLPTQPVFWGGPGGSGGGGGYAPQGFSVTGPSSGGVGNVPPVSPPQGFPGGANNSGPGAGAGGGGATEAGLDNSNPSNGRGGAGATTPWIPSSFGASGYFSGGGGGGMNNPGLPYPNGSPVGGGGTGCGPGPGSRPASSGVTNTGGGGGGGNAGVITSGGGGSGVVIIRYVF